MDTHIEDPGSARVAIVAASGEDGHEFGLWRRLREHNDSAAREELIILHLPYARVVAASYYAKRFHDEIEFGDYFQLASIGMLEALDRYDPQRGAQFRTFAARRMHGAILNGLERLTEKQQQIATLQRLRAERVQAVKEMALQQADGRSGIATATKAPDQLLKYIAEVGLGLALSWMLEGTSMVEDSSRTESIPFYRSAEMRQLRERIAQLIESLPTQESNVIRSHYVQEMPFDQIAVTLSLTKGRISQIHKQALMHLRAYASA